MTPNDELLQRISQTRRKWRNFVAIRGAAWTLGVAVVASLAILAAIETGGSSRVLMAVTVIGAFGVIVTALLALARPLLQRPSDEQMARFVQERNPGLDDCLVTAVETIQRPNPNHGPFGVLLVRSTLDRTRNVRFGEEIDKRKSRAFTAASAVLAVIFAVLISPWLTPLIFPHANGVIKGLGNRPSNAQEIRITPGTVTVPRGSDVRIEAVISGFEATRATSRMRYESGQDWESATMDVVPKNPYAFRHTVFNIQETVRYYVEAADRKSAEFTITVADLPRVEKVDYTYNYPPYTGLAPRKDENAINIAALRGTMVDVFVTASQALSGGRLVFDDGKSIVLRPLGDKKTASGRLPVERDATFRIELTNTKGASFLSLEDRSIEVLEDGKPILTFTRPGRDYSASTLEEVFSELKAEDDYGVRSLSLFYSVNGGPEKRVDLFKSDSATGTPRDISAPHTFFLEDFNLSPGDFISYYGRAEDSKTPPNKVTTDVYFIDVRPFGRQISQASAGGGGGGGGGGNDADSIQVLLRGEKDVVAATHKLVSGKDNYKPAEWSSYLRSVSSKQKKLAEQTTRMLDRIDSRDLDDKDPTVKEIVEHLKLSRDAMLETVKRLDKETPEPALETEQKALTEIGRASALFTKFQISRGGGQGGGRPSAQLDLQELADLELDQNKNQFETQQRGQADQSKQLDDALDELKGLAERQQRQNEQRSKPGAQASNQELRDQIEKLARQLEKLSRENNDPKLAEVAKQLERASESLRQQQQATNDRTSAQAGAEASAAIERAQQILNQQNQQRNGAGERLAEAGRQSQQLAEMQRDIAKETGDVARNPAESSKQKQQINQQKDALESGLNALKRQLDAMANGADKDSANRARGASGTIRDRRIAEGIDAGRKNLNSGAYGAAQQQEERNQQALEDLAQQLKQSAASASGKPNPGADPKAEQKRLEDAVAEASQLADRMQSLTRRIQASAGNRGEGGQPQPDGRGGERGTPGNPGQNPASQPNRGSQPGSQPGQQPGQRAGSPQGSQPGQQAGQGNQPGQSNQPGQGSQSGQSPSSATASSSPGGRGEPGQGTNPAGGRGQPNSGAPSGGQAPNGNSPSPFAGLDPRQIASEIGQYQRDARELRNTLGEGNPFGAELNKVDETLRSMGSGGAAGAGDPKKIEQLAHDLIEPLRKMEFELSRQLDLLQNKERLQSAREEDIPSALKGVIGNYFEQLGRSKR